MANHAAKTAEAAIEEVIKVFMSPQYFDTNTKCHNFVLLHGLSILVVYLGTQGLLLISFHDKQMIFS